MAPGKRAKIFSPFAALKGFEDGIEAKRVEYEPRRELTEGEIEELDRRLNILWQLTRNSVLARKNRITVSVRVFIPCSDRNSDAYGSLGQYHTVTGRVTQVNNCFLRLDERKIFLKDILSIESGERMDGRALFEAFWVDGA